MANSKISALTSATTPLAGTETLPIVQSSTTKQVSVANLTVGRAVTATSFTVSTQTGFVGSSGDTNIASNWIYFKNTAGTTEYGRWTSGGDLINYNNFIQGTAAKGINFTANTPAAGMTSQLLNWYEEGTWTPNQGAGLTVVGAFSSTGKYTRIGREVIVSGTVTGATSVAVAAAGIITSNLPFTVGTAGHGNVTNAALTSFAAIICTSTNITSAGAIAATGTLTFSTTYFV
jgi:hypothetical protein